jgi:hypothetical protein
MLHLISYPFPRLASPAVSPERALGTEFAAMFATSATFDNHIAFIPSHHLEVVLAHVFLYELVARQG